ncbi:ATP-binding protein [Candidatus Woesearchaeota archaeon]|nr:ATP-binding protein [Candidatus Woesearchaeota archaeon]
MYVERSIKEVFDKVKEVYMIIAVVGARQAGKTTFLKEQIKGIKAGYLLFDDPDIRELFEADIKKFELQYLGQDLVVFDEVHYCREAGPKLKYLADSGHKIWLTSSSGIILGKDILSYLVGRVSVLKLYPFSFSEFLSAKGQKAMSNKVEKRLVWEHLTYGGYPKVILAEDNELKKIILRDLHDTMLLKDVARTFSIDDISSLEKASKYLSNNIGGILSYNSATNVLGISFPTLKKYLDALEKSYLVTLIPPYCKNKNKEISKQPKIYFIDTGMRNAVAGSFASVVDGKLFENYVLSELLKAGFSPKYWRTKAGAEVDFVIEAGEKIIPIECKLYADSAKRSLNSFINTYGPSHAFVVNYEGLTWGKKTMGCTVTGCGVGKLISYLNTLLA